MRNSTGGDNLKENNVRKSLMRQLEKKGAKLDHFIDLVDDYIKFWNIKNKLYDDVETRGVMFTDMSSVGIPMQKNNPSVKELTSVNKQMLVLLEKLDINTKNSLDGEDNEL